MVISAANPSGRRVSVTFRGCPPSEPVVEEIRRMAAACGAVSADAVVDGQSDAIEVQVGMNVDLVRIDARAREDTMQRATEVAVRQAMVMLHKLLPFRRTFHRH